MSDTGRDNEGMGLTAAEYVLGVLDATQRGAAERRIGRDPAFAREVAFWEERLGGLASAVPEVAPPRRLWSRIEDSDRCRSPRDCRAVAQLELLAEPCLWRERARRRLPRRAHLCWRGRNAGCAARRPARRRWRAGGLCRRRQHRRSEPHHRARGAPRPGAEILGALADPARRQAAFARAHRSGPAGHDQGAERSSDPGQQRGRARGLARASWRIAHRPAHRAR